MKMMSKTNSEKVKKLEVGNMKKGIFEEVELAIDLQQYIMHSKDVKIEQDLKNVIANFNPDTLLSVTMKIQSQLEIVSVKIVDDDFIKNAFPSVKI